MNFNMSCDDSTIFYNHPDDDDLPSLPPQCSLIQLPVAASKTRYASDLFRLLTGNFSLKVLPNWRARRQCIDCPSRGGGQCLINSKGYLHCSNGIVATASYGHEKSELKLGLGLGGGSIVLIALLSFWIMFYRKFSSYDSTGSCLNIETFLRNHGSLAPRRYSYADIKKMTNSFKYKLGQGGYGSVYKGKLIDGSNVAVKVLNDSKGNGEEFINEVASISRTSHVNVVTLLGFCFEGRRRALIYEFVSNGSLEKFIYRNSSSIENHKLTWETLLQIAVGIARGLEYLHLGCSTRILHFDIKPHNILLDEDFCPKISDFGLAKICNRKESIISMTGARGTVGYIAPEVFCRNIGEVSYKSDVYSYGMMIFKMTGGRKNVDVGDNGSSDIYFPHWIYKRLEKDEELGLQGIENEQDKEYARKMIIVSLWCIQTNPSSRPTMNRVVEMLEASLDSLQIPPKPFLSSPGSPADSSTIQSIADSSKSILITL
ncbi:rust resistance kinase Lr10-like isoform X2 [Citrus sinensis]|uniref:rust resistance kinase Lr10-like isoform X2 n=1 Tax=Citrus sinensis TaxID=2711 RepID=UPI00076363CA|nr:rust resistance kinase Lr10-like isoform X2 [Citrus sinensis]